MRKKSELESLLHEYRVLNKISSNVVNDTLIHSTNFHCWLANIVIDTINYEKLLLEVLNYEFNDLDIKKIAEIYSRPILSVAETITNNFVNTINYNGYDNELGEDDKYQMHKSELLKNIDSVDLLITQSTQFEDIKKQREKLTIIRDFVISKNLPFIIGCYGNLNGIEFQKREDVLDEFKNLLGTDIKIYKETYNGIDCEFFINNPKVKVL